MPKKLKIGFIGAGNLGEAILSGLIQKKIYSPREIGITTAHSSNRKRVNKKLHVSAFSKNSALTQQARVLLLAVKPQQMKSVLKEISPHIKKSHLILTVAAGLDTSFYKKYLPRGTRLVRVMPNTPIQIGMGMTGIYASATCRPEDKRLAFKIFSAIGECTFLVNEDQLDVITALSAGGPAFVYFFIEALIQSGEKLGLSKAKATQLVFGTLLGAAHLAKQSNDSLEKMISKVASKKGTTEAGLKILKRLHFGATVEKTIRASTKRAGELRKILGKA